MSDPGAAAADGVYKAIASLKLTGVCPDRYCMLDLNLFGLVMHLNDAHSWQREEIADWLEELAEERGYDLSFPTPEEIPAEPGEESLKHLTEET